MDAFYTWLNTLVNKNKSNFAKYADINWLHAYNSAGAQQQRDQLLSQIGDSVLFKDTKPYYNHISKGCSICGSGRWSCLFITGKCNAGCFYCPAPQITDEPPSTQGLDFNNPLDYAEYIKYFNFKGVSFSGGEPLLHFDRTLGYLKKVRQLCSPDIYTWMYTNGILANNEKMAQLADTGLNEIRFDIGATGFSLDKIKHAKGIIPSITIEIPAIPEEKDRLIKLLPKMIRAGVTNLNLHQLRLTKHNARHLMKRDYTYISAEKPLVLESELAALEIVNAAREQNLEMGVNYCSFFFKHRFQKAGFRRQILHQFSPPKATITENGYIREYSGNSISYKTYKMYDKNSAYKNVHEFNLTGKKYYYSEETVFTEKGLSQQYQEQIKKLLECEPTEIPVDPLLFRIWQMEYMERGLREY